MISYKPLQKLLIDEDIQKKELVEEANISWNTMAKFNTNEYVSLRIIEKVCLALDCQPGSIIKIIPDQKEKSSGN